MQKLYVRTLARPKPNLTHPHAAGLYVAPSANVISTIRQESGGTARGLTGGHLSFGWVDAPGKRIAVLAGALFLFLSTGDSALLAFRDGWTHATRRIFGAFARTSSRPWNGHVRGVRSSTAERERTAERNGSRSSVALSAASSHGSRAGEEEGDALARRQTVPAPLLRSSAPADYGRTHGLTAALPHTQTCALTRKRDRGDRNPTTFVYMCVRCMYVRTHHTARPVASRPATHMHPRTPPAGAIAIAGCVW